jgi:hypothetical protein
MNQTSMKQVIPIAIASVSLFVGVVSITTAAVMWMSGESVARIENSGLLEQKMQTIASRLDLMEHRQELFERAWHREREHLIQEIQSLQRLVESLLMRSGEDVGYNILGPMVQPRPLPAPVPAIEYRFAATGTLESDIRRLTRGQFQ